MKKKSVVSISVLVRALMCMSAVTLVGCAGTDKSAVGVGGDTPTVDYVERLDVYSAPHKDSFLNQLAMNYRSFAIYNARTSGNPDVGELFAQKAVVAFSGDTPLPESVENWPIRDEQTVFEITSAYNDLVEQLKMDVDYTSPELAAEAQAKYDCWVSATASGQNGTAQECRNRFNKALYALQTRTGKMISKQVAGEVESIKMETMQDGYYVDTRGLSTVHGRTQSRDGLVIVNNVNVPEHLINPVSAEAVQQALQAAQQAQPIVFNQNIYGGDKTVSNSGNNNGNDSSQSTTFAEKNVSKNSNNTRTDNSDNSDNSQFNSFTERHANSHNADSSQYTDNRDNSDNSQFNSFTERHANSHNADSSQYTDNRDNSDNSQFNSFTERHANSHNADNGQYTDNSQVNNYSDRVENSHNSDNSDHSDNSQFNSFTERNANSHNVDDNSDRSQVTSFSERHANSHNIDDNSNHSQVTSYTERDSNNETIRMMAFNERGEVVSEDISTCNYDRKGQCQCDQGPTDATVCEAAIVAQAQQVGAAPLNDGLVSRNEFVEMMAAMREELAAINRRLDKLQAKSGEKTMIKVQQIPLEPKQHVMEEVFEVRFDFNKAVIKPEYKDLIEKLATATQANKNIKVSVIGHTDTVGSSNYNYALGGRRADAVQKMLIKYGIPASQIVAVSAGEEDLAVPTPDGVANAANRRVQVIKEIHTTEEVEGAPVQLEVSEFNGEDCGFDTCAQ